MSEPASSLFPEPPEAVAANRRHSTGILPSQVIRELVRGHEIEAAAEISEAQIQPASIDLRLDGIAYRVRASFLPGPEATVEDKIESFGMHQIDLSQGAVLEKGCVYIVPLIEHLRLGGETFGVANPKSSTGRLDIFTRLITDHATEFERVKAGYKGPLYAEISPRAFSVVVRKGSRLNQLRLRRGSHAYSDNALRRLNEQVRLIDKPLGKEDISNGLPLSIDLRGDPKTGLIGYKAKPHAGLIDVDKVGHYAIADFWETVDAGPENGIILNPNDFYVLVSKEAVTVPPDHAAEMVAYDTLVGEFRVHYAGFFDPGFGHAPGLSSYAKATEDRPSEARRVQEGGTRAVLEVRSHEVPFLVEDGQVVGRLIYERLTEVPDKLYGTTIGSSYHRQRLALSKQFRPAGDSRVS